MTMPRPVFPGTTYLVGRRCTQRQFLLRPDEQVNAVFLYCLALAARASDVLVHAALAQANHYHAVVTDPKGMIVEFYRNLHSLVGRAVNRLRERSENLWSSAQTERIALLDSAKVLEKVVYTITNPVKDGLVSSHDKWPGVVLYLPQTLVIKRPDVLFRVDGSLPAEVELTITPPPIGVVGDQVVEVLEEAIAAEEARLREEMRAAGRTFLGAAAVLHQEVTDSPDSEDVPGRPLPVAASCKDVRKAALARLREWVSAYRAALRAWCEGAREVIFPPGTYLMARRYQVAVAEP